MCARKLANNWMSFFYDMNAYKMGIEFNEKFNSD